MTDLNSTARRRELGARLRRLRELCGVNGSDMAAKLNWHPTMVSRAETGKRTMSTLEVATYTGLCGVVGEDQKELLDLVDEPDDYRLKAHPGDIPDALQALIHCESTATTIDTYEPMFIPGLMQTPEYARAVFEETGFFDPSIIEGRVQIRMSRRDVLTRINPVQCATFIHENALRASVGSARIMTEQMLQLIFAGGRPQCSIRVVPAAAGTRGLVEGSFHIFGYTDGSPVVYLQHATTCEFLENVPDLKTYRSLLNRIATVALSEARSRDFITWLASEYEQQGAAKHEDGPGR